MPLMAETPTGKTFQTPKEGTTQAVLNAVKDLGMVDTVFNGVAKKVHKVQFVWQLDEKGEDGKPLLIFERFTLSLHEKAQLFKRIKGLFGKNPPASLDLEKLIGTNTNLVVTHNEGKDKNGQPRVFANIAATLKLNTGQKKLDIVPLDQIIQKKDGKADSRAGQPVTEDNPITPDEIPF